MDRAELNEIGSRYAQAYEAFLDSTWPQRVDTYGPVVAKRIMESWMDVPKLLEALRG